MSATEYTDHTDTADNTGNWYEIKMEPIPAQNRKGIFVDAPEAEGVDVIDGAPAPDDVPEGRNASGKRRKITAFSPVHLTDQVPAGHYKGYGEHGCDCEPCVMANRLYQALPFRQQRAGTYVWRGPKPKLLNDILDEYNKLGWPEVHYIKGWGEGRAQNLADNIVQAHKCIGKPIPAPEDRLPITPGSITPSGELKLTLEENITALEETVITSVALLDAAIEIVRAVAEGSTWFQEHPVHAIAMKSWGREATEFVEHYTTETTDTEEEAT